MLVGRRSRNDGDDVFTAMMATTGPRGWHSMHLEIVSLVGYEFLLMLVHGGGRNRGRLLPRRDGGLSRRRGRAIAASATAGCRSDEGGSRAKEGVELGVDGRFDVDRVGGCFGVDEGDEDA